VSSVVKDVFVVDASVWVARYKPQDINHESSSRWLHLVLSRGLDVVGPTLLLPEVGGPIAREVSELDARRVLAELGRLFKLRLLPLGHELARLAARFAAQFQLRGADSVYVALAHELGIPLVTWDGEQRARAPGAVTVQTPAELLGSSPP
jgi:predicted nucleic acid-binding protein